MWQILISKDWDQHLYRIYYIHSSPDPSKFSLPCMEIVWMPYVFLSCTLHSWTARKSMNDWHCRLWSAPFSSTKEKVKSKCPEFAICFGFLSTSSWPALQWHRLSCWQHPNCICPSCQVSFASTSLPSQVSTAHRQRLQLQLHDGPSVFCHPVDKPVVHGLTGLTGPVQATFALQEQRASHIPRPLAHWSPHLEEESPVVGEILAPMQVFLGRPCRCCKG